MRELIEIETKYEQLPVAKRHLFLAACIRHVAGAFSRVAGLPPVVQNDAVGPTVAALELSSPTASVLSKVVADCERIADALGETGDGDLQSLVFACAAAAETAADAKKPMKFVVNNLDETVGMCDPEEEPGCDEEFDLRLRFLDALAGSEREVALSSLVNEVLDWEGRWEADFRA